MTEPRIYTYKITFPNQGWWYWGAHKEKKAGEEYNGSPKVHSDKWSWFEYEKQILEYHDTWEDCLKVEARLIMPDLNNPMCLNEGCNGFISEAYASLGGERCPREVQVRNGLESQRKRREDGVHPWLGQTKEERVELGKKVGRHSWETQTGSHSPELTKQRHDKLRAMNYSRWRCLVTGYITSPGPLSRYQRKRGIDTSMREKVE